MKNSYRAALAVILVAVVGLLAYSNTFNNEFVLDDKETIVSNEIIKDLHYFIEPSDARIFESNVKTKYVIRGNHNEIARERKHAAHGVSK